MCNRRGLVHEKNIRMKQKTLMVLLLTWFALPSHAQTNYFLWLQSDQQQYFQVEIHGKSYESSQGGYVVIPKMPSGLYEIRIYPGADKKSLQIFNLQIIQADRGFALKQREGQWVLMDLFDFQIIQAVDAKLTNPHSNQPKQQEITKEADQINLSQKPINQISSGSVTNSSTIDSIQGKKDEKVQEEVQQIQPIIKVPIKKGDSGIRRTYDKKTPQGIDLVFIDHSGGESDTIIIFIPDPEKQMESNRLKTIPKYQLLVQYVNFMCRGVSFRKEEIWQIS